MAEGVCKLTKNRGKLVKSHIIPRAFSDLALDRTKRLEFGSYGKRPTLKHTSWYDPEIVTIEGERKLARFDEIAKNEFERLGLTWRFFPIKNTVHRESIGDTDIELLKARTDYAREIRLFILSVLWRAIYSKRAEFGEINTDVSSREKLRKIVNEEIEAHPADFPITLVLLTSKGQPQVQAPRRDRMAVPQLAPGIKPTQKIFRLFFDGLIAHVGRKKMDVQLMSNWRGRCVGLSDELVIIGRPYEGSHQEEFIASMQNELEEKWPEDAKRIYGAL